MNKHTTTSGPTGLTRIRSLLAFRHQSPVARLISTIAAFAVAMLLAIGPSAAYADDTAPPADPAATDTTAPADPAPATDPAPVADPASATDPAPATDPATSTDTLAPASDSTTTSTSTSSPKTTTSQKLASPTPNLVGNAACEAGLGTIVPNLANGFQIDGDPCDEGPTTTLDFENGPGTSVDDEFGSKTDDAFTGGSSENNDPSGWALTGPQPTGKADIGTVWAYSANIGGDVYAYFGFTNDSTSGGTQDYSLEYDQHDPTTGGLPVRTPGDLLFHFASTGSNTLDYVASYIYRLQSDSLYDTQTCEAVTSSSPAAGWCPKTLPADAWTADASSTGEYVEGAINISAMFGEGNCSGVFGTTFLRSAPGSYWTSQMKDYVAPLGVSTPSTCASLVIKKFAAGTTTLLTGAHFDVYSGTTATGTPILSDVYDGKAGVDTDSVSGQITLTGLEPGTYTVKETTAPTGYLLPPDTTCNTYPFTEANACRTETTTVGTSSTVTYNFYDPKQWSALTAMKTAQGDYDTTYTWTISKGVRYGADAFASTASKDSGSLTENFDWKVSIGEGTRTESNHVVSGAITISNPNSTAVVATITDSLSPCTFYDPADTTPPLTALADADSGTPGFQVSVPANGSGSGTVYQYTCTQSNKDATTNTATVAVDRSEYPRNQADLTATDSYNAGVTPGTGNTLSPSITWTEHPDGTKVIEVTDVLQGTTTTHVNSGAPWTHTWGDHADPTWNAGTSKYEHVYSAPVTATAGHCASVTNTATITDTGQYAEATASHCVNADLTVDVTASESLTRTFLWDINKSTTTPNLTNTTGSVVAHYGVVITALPYADSNWEIHGTATVTNPNAFTAEQVSDLAVAYSGGGTCVLDDPLPNVAASGSAPVDYHCTFASAPSSLDGQVTATVKWNADADSASDPTPAAVTEADWLAGTGTVLVNQFIKVFDNHAVPGTQDPLFAGAQLKWQDVFASTSPAAHQVAVEYDHTYTGSAMPAAGTCSNLVNTAWFTGDAAATVLGSDTATVQVCTPAVIVSPPEQQHPNVLPNTGGPALGLLAAGLVLLIGGGVLIAGDRRTRRRS